jgi:hypothetical protein
MRVIFETISLEQALPPFLSLFEKAYALVTHATLQECAAWAK